MSGNLKKPSPRLAMAIKSHEASHGHAYRLMRFAAGQAAGKPYCITCRSEQWSRRYAASAKRRKVHAATALKSYHKRKSEKE